jgi:hypothetical protein
MPEPGQRSKETMLFMLPPDEEAFGASLTQALAGRALWLDSPGWGRQPGQHQLLGAALTAGQGGQAFLRVTDPDSVPTGPGLQYLRGRVWRYDNGAEFLRQGRLAYKWFPAQEPDWVAERFTALIGLAWRHLLACTHPHVADLEDRPVRRARIGPHAKAWVRADTNRWLGEWAPYQVFKLLPGR